jgi:hypothetical protein
MQISFLGFILTKDTNTLTTCCFLIRPILAILLFIAQLRWIDAQWLSIWRTLWTHEFSPWTNCHRAGFLVRTILTIFITITMICYRNAERIGASELVAGARRKICTSSKSLNSVTCAINLI